MEFCLKFKKNLNQLVMPNGEYGKKGLYIGLFAIVGSGGISRILELNLREEEQEKLNVACNTIGEFCSNVNV